MVLLLVFWILKLVFILENSIKEPKTPFLNRLKGSDKSVSGIKLVSKQFFIAPLILTRYNCRPLAGGNISLIIPFSLPIVLMVTLGNVNLFFPALTIIIGAHYLPFIYAYNLKTYWILSILLVIGGSFFGFILTGSFDYCAYYTGSMLLLFAILNRYLTQEEIKNNTA